MNDTSAVRKAADMLLNCVDPHNVEVRVSMTKVELFMPGTHANIVDSRSLTEYLERLQSGGIVGEDVKTVWVGFKDGKFCVWSAR